MSVTSSRNVTVLSGDIDGNDTTDANGIVTSVDDINGANAYHVTRASGLTAGRTGRVHGDGRTGGRYGRDAV